MLGRLARWLRVLGYDTSYACRAEDDELLHLAKLEDRILLTRDAALAARSGDVRSILVEHDQLDEQMAQLAASAGVDVDRPAFTRCLECNTAILPADRDAVREQVPPYVFARHDRFHRCPSCGRVYWAGSHLGRMALRLEALRGSVARSRAAGEHPG
jgi:uncharacterized protein with PIN domain